jgi:hypothetical protein
VTGSCEHGSGHSCFTKGGEFLDYLNDLDSHEGLCSMELVMCINAETVPALRHVVTNTLI